MIEDQHLLDRYLAARPSDVDTARAAVAPFRDMTPRARIDALVMLLCEMDAILAGRPPFRSPDDIDLWRHWKDPSLGCPR